MRVGIGFDVHRLVKDRPLILGGIQMDSDKGLLGHSDADVLLHAICDALLGAAGLGDIGDHFPDNDPVYKDISSLKLLAKVVEMLNGSGLCTRNLDATLMAEAPRIAPYREKIKEKVADVLQTSPANVNIKATSTEGLGFAGRGEGIGALCIVLIGSEDEDG